MSCPGGPAGPSGPVPEVPRVSDPVPEEIPQVSSPGGGPAGLSGAVPGAAPPARRRARRSNNNTRAAGAEVWFTCRWGGETVRQHGCTAAAASGGTWGQPGYRRADYPLVPRGHRRSPGELQVRSEQQLLSDIRGHVW